MSNVIRDELYLKWLNQCKVLAEKLISQANEFQQHPIVLNEGYYFFEGAEKLLKQTLEDLRNLPSDPDKFHGDEYLWNIQNKMEFLGVCFRFEKTAEETFERYECFFGEKCCLIKTMEG